VRETVAIELFSDVEMRGQVRRKRLPMPCGLPEFGRRFTVHLTERRAEVAVTGKAKFQRERGQIVAVGEEIQRARQPQAQLIPIQRKAFDLLEHLREIDR
jgi:hypothetical protein